VRDFAKEKKQLAMAKESPETGHNSLPGWGDWTGHHQRKRSRNPRTSNLVDGKSSAGKAKASLSPQPNRGLPHIILNEKGAKKVSS